MLGQNRNTTFQRERGVTINFIHVYRNEHFVSLSDYGIWQKEKKHVMINDIKHLLFFSWDAFTALRFNVKTSFFLSLVAGSWPSSTALLCQTSWRFCSVVGVNPQTEHFVQFSFSSKHTWDSSLIHISKSDWWIYPNLLSLQKPCVLLLSNLWLKRIQAFQMSSLTTKKL